MSQYATELCLLLVDDVYGELTSRAFSALICYGRLSIAALLHYTGLTPRQVKHSLAVLIQQHLALWYTSPENAVTYYEANWTSAYALLRAGKFVWIVEERLGSFAGGIVSNMLLSGHAGIGDLAQAYNILPHTDSGVSLNEPAIVSNGDIQNGEFQAATQSHNESADSFHSSLHTLLDRGFLSSVHESYFRSDADNRSEAEALVRSLKGFHGELKADQKQELADAVEQRLLDWRLGTDGDTEAFTVTAFEKPVKGRKRKWKAELDIIDETGKRRRSNAQNVHTVAPSFQHEEDSPLQQETEATLRVNYEKFAVVARNEKLVELVEERIGPATSRVYAEVLGHLEKKLKFCDPSTGENDKADDLGLSPKVTTAEIASAMAKLEDLAGGIGLADPSMINLNTIIHPKKRRRRFDTNEQHPDGETSATEEDDSDSEQQNGNITDVDNDSDEVNGDDEYKSEIKVEKDGDQAQQPPATISSLSNPQSCLFLTRQNLFLLAEHPYNFVTFIPRSHSTTESWSVNFPALARQLRLIELENIITKRYGIEALRIIRILQEKGKLDEKAIATLALMNQKIMRSILTTMHEAGHLEIQEVPRDNARQPARTIFLWFFDPERCRQKVLEETYKTMARCMQRSKAERGNVQSIIDKASRTDVVGKEDELLGLDERTALKAWRENEERLLGELGRLDDLVAVLRDF
ncbi:RNA polymerase III subunit C82 [Xylographa trunciseda]|nr:RNA polymerase III subunit C82 [Xylographa trunciseda]